MNRLLIAIMYFAVHLLLPVTALAQESSYLDSIVASYYPVTSTLPVVRFVRPDTVKNLEVIGRFFFGGPLSIDMAKVDTGRYLYFSNGYSKLWYYPMSGAFDWIRTALPINVEFSTSDESLTVLGDIALSVISAIHGSEGSVFERIEFVGNSKIVAYTGTYDSGGNDTESYVRSVDVRFRQSVCGLPVHHGSWAAVTFCGDMEICRVRVLLREIEDVVETEPAPVETVIASMKTSASRLDGLYYVSGLDTTREPEIAYFVRSESYFQSGAAPQIVVPVCRSAVDAKTVDCEIRTSINAPLVYEHEGIEGAERALVISNKSLDVPVVVELPAACDGAANGRECVP